MRPSPAPQAVCLVCLLTGDAHRQRTEAGLNSHELSPQATDRSGFELTRTQLCYNVLRQAHRQRTEAGTKAHERGAAVCQVPTALGPGGRARRALPASLAGRRRPACRTGPGHRTGPTRRWPLLRGVKRWPLLREEKLRDVTQMPSAAAEVTAGHGGSHRGEGGRFSAM